MVPWYIAHPYVAAMNNDISFQQAATRANPRLYEGYPVLLTIQERGGFEIDLLKTVFGDSAHFSRVPGDGNCFWWAVLRAILKNPTVSWDKGQRATDQMKFLKTLFGQIYHNTITAKINENGKDNENKLPWPVDKDSFNPDLSKYTEQDVFAYVSAFLNRPVWLFSKNEEARNGFVYETSTVLQCYDQRENNKNVIERLITNNENTIKQFEETIDTIDSIHEKYPNNEPLVFLFQGHNGRGHYEVVTGYEYKIENYDALLQDHVEKGTLENILTFDGQQTFVQKTNDVHKSKDQENSAVKSQHDLTHEDMAKEGPSEHSVAEQASNPLHYEENASPAISLISEELPEYRGSTMKMLIYKDPKLRQSNINMEEPKYILRQKSTNGGCHACKEMLLLDASHGTRDIDWENVDGGGGQFGCDFLLEDERFVPVDGSSPVYPRICKILGHFIVVDCVDAQYIYFRDPWTATVRRILVALVLNGLNFDDFLEGSALKEHANRFNQTG